MEVSVKIMGKKLQVVEVEDGSSVQDVMEALELDGNFTINVGGSPADSSQALNDGDYIVFAPSVKGANMEYISEDEAQDENDLVGDGEGESEEEASEEALDELITELEEDTTDYAPQA